MNLTDKNHFTRFAIVTVIGLLLAGCDGKPAAETLATAVPSAPAVTAPAQNQVAAPMAMTPELKKDMADMYQKMADCLRTEKSPDQCSSDTMKDCPVMQKTGRCPIHEGMGAAMGGSMGEHAKDAMGHMNGMDMDHTKDTQPSRNPPQ